MRAARITALRRPRQVDEVLVAAPRADGAELTSRHLNPMTAMARAGRERHSAQDRPKRALMVSGSHPEAVLGLGVVARCSTTTRRLISPLRTALRNVG